jgi:molecular chaperone IbpA
MTNTFSMGRSFPNSFVGFDRLFHDLEKLSSRQEPSFPPHNIVRVGDNRYIIELAVAGYNRDSIDIDVNDRELVITGDLGDTKREDLEYEYKGISQRKFKRAFTLSEYVEVMGAELNDGILSIHLERILPDEKQPRKVEIEYNSKTYEPEYLAESVDEKDIVI